MKTLEEYFRDVAQALFDARPLTTVTIGGDGDDGVSFIELFGRPLIKEDIILSTVEDSQGRIWVGTLGGGIRRVEFYRGRWQDRLHITRTGVVRTESDTNRLDVVSHSGIGGNIIFSLAVGPDDSVWAATEKGVSRIQVGDEDVVISNFSTLDGLEAPAFMPLSGNASLLWVLLEQFRDTPVRDIVVDREGIAWAVKNAGLYQISPQGWQLQGRVLDTTDSSVIGADITVLREVEIDNYPFPTTVALHTPFQTITDTNGNFIINGLPTGQARLRVNGKSAANGSFTVQELHVEVLRDVQGIEFRLNHDSDGDGVGDEDEMMHGTDPKRMDTDEGGQTDGVEIETDGTNPLDPRDDLVRNGPVDLSITKENTGAMIISGRSALYINASTDRRAMISGCSTVDIRRSLNGIAFPLDCTGASVGRGPHFAAPTGIAQEHAGSFVVSNRGGFRGAPPGATVMRVDPHTGARSLVSGCIDHPACTSIVGHGPLFGSPEDITVEPTGALVVVDSDRRAVVRVDPLTGDRTIVSDDSHGGGIPFGFPEGIAVESTGTLIVVDSRREGVVRATVVRVDPLTGDRTIVSDDSHGGGIPFGSLYLEDIAVEPTGALVVVDSDRRAVVRVDPLTGDRTIVSNDEHGDGSTFVSPQAIGVESSGTLLVADTSTFLGKGELVIVRVDPLTGDRTFVDLNNSP